MEEQTQKGKSDAVFEEKDVVIKNQNYPKVKIVYCRFAIPDETLTYEKQRIEPLRKSLISYLNSHKMGNIRRTRSRMLPQILPERYYKIGYDEKRTTKYVEFKVIFGKGHRVKHNAIVEEIIRWFEVD